ncbi:hypothetical protein [Alkalimonas amylolytica]|nr:hypothetical protein [Alkalimonas amylolytica]
MESVFPKVQAIELPYVQTSIVQLKAHPERYYDRNISIKGFYLHPQGITLSKDHNLSRELAVEVITDDPELTYDVCGTHWVILEGHLLKVFDRELRHNIPLIIADRLTIKESGDVCWQRTEPFDF